MNERYEVVMYNGAQRVPIETHWQQWKDVVLRYPTASRSQAAIDARRAVRHTDPPATILWPVFHRVAMQRGIPIGMSGANLSVPTGGQI